MEAQGNLNEEQLDDGQAAEVLADLNGNDIENQAPINYIDDYMRDYMMDKNKAFENKLLDGSFNSLADAYQMLSLESTKKDRGSVIRQFRGSRSAFKTHVVCVTDKNASLANRTCTYSAVIKKKRTKDNNKYYIEKEGRNLNHGENCLRNSANCPGNTTMKSRFMQHVQALHPISLVTTGKAVSKTLAEKEQMTVRPKQAKVVLNKRNGNTKEAYRNSMKEVAYYKIFFNVAGNGAKMDVRWRDGSPAHGLLQNGNKYFYGYQICAIGLRNFVAKVGIPFFSFDACFSKHTYYKGVYGNLVALVDTKAESLTNVPVALPTDESEQESLYNGLLNISECNNADSELAKLMKESVSCVIGDGSPQFLNAARTTLGHQKPICTCSLHVKENTRKRCKTGWNEDLFWRLQKARSLRERAAAWAAIERTFSQPAVNYLRAQLDDDMSDHGRPWTRFSHMQKGICTFGRKGTNNPVEQVHSKQVPERHDEPLKLLTTWVEEKVRKKEEAILEAAEKLRGKSLTPWAQGIFDINHDAVRTCRIGNGRVVPVINPDVAVEVVQPNENGNQRESRYHVNLNARTCTCTNWHFNGIACCHALKAWDVYHAQKKDIALNVYGQRMREWAVNSKPWFLAAKFIEAAEVLKEELIKLPADAEIEEDDTLFPPICLARLNRGVPVAPQGRPRRRRINGVVRRCGNCNQPGHNRSKCRFNSVWFDWNDENDYPFQEVYRRSIPGAQ